MGLEEGCAKWVPPWPPPQLPRFSLPNPIAFFNVKNSSETMQHTSNAHIRLWIFLQIVSSCARERGGLHIELDRAGGVPAPDCRSALYVSFLLQKEFIKLGPGQIWPTRCLHYCVCVDLSNWLQRLTISNTPPALDLGSRIKHICKEMLSSQTPLGVLMDKDYNAHSPSMQIYISTWLELNLKSSQPARVSLLPPQLNYTVLLFLGQGNRPSSYVHGLQSKKISGIREGANQQLCSHEPARRVSTWLISPSTHGILTARLISLQTCSDLSVLDPSKHRAEKQTSAGPSFHKLFSICPTQSGVEIGTLF